MRSLVYSVSAQLWQESTLHLKEKVEFYEKIFKCKNKAIRHNKNGISLAPCTSQHWRQDCGIEHDQSTCYFQHWFRWEGKIRNACNFSHLALMHLIRSTIWNGFLYEFLTGELLNRDAVRLRVENELEHYSNLTNSQLRQQIGILSQDFFNMLKVYLNAADKPVNKTGLASVEKIVLNENGVKYANPRKGWSNRKLRAELAQRIVDAGICDLPTRTEQEAFALQWLSVESSLKESAVAAVMRVLKNMVDETGIVALKPYTKEEISRHKSDGKKKQYAEQVFQRAKEINDKISKGEKLSAAERKFKCVNKELFESKPTKSNKIPQKETQKSVTAKPTIHNIVSITDSGFSRNKSKPTKSNKRNFQNKSNLPSRKHNATLNFGVAKEIK